MKFNREDFIEHRTQKAANGLGYTNKELKHLLKEKKIYIGYEGYGNDELKPVYHVPRTRDFRQWEKAEKS